MTMRNMWLAATTVVAMVAVALALTRTTSGRVQYEVWAIDQSDSPGKTFGGTLYIWDGHELERQKGVKDQRAEAKDAGAGFNPLRRRPPTSERIDLGGEVSLLCLSRTGANPVRPHMIAVNPAQTHVIVSFVATGHVLFIEAASREPVECIRTSAGVGGVRQAHMATPSPDGTYVTVANQNGKLFERITTDYGRNEFQLDPSATINLATCLTPGGLPCESKELRPDNAPICPITESSSRFTFVTLRGGGLFVVDSRTTPMQIVGEYDQTFVHGNGCLGAESLGKMYIDSGGGTTANLYQADLYVFPLSGFSSTPNPPNMPRPAVVFNESDQMHADAHGAALARQDRFLWIADRGRNFLWVVDTRTDKVVNRIQLVNELSVDPTPDLLSVSPDASHVFMSLRGPVPLTADPHVSTGSTPGIGVLKVLQGGRSAAFEYIARVSNVNDAGVERADVHASTVRLKVERDRRQGGDR
jgi:DNA-binding beta-propeller fold protein YncE